MTNKSKIISIGILVLILFCGGVIAGYLLWGIADGEKRDFPALLREAAQYVARLETRKSELEIQLEAKEQKEAAIGKSKTPAEATPSEAPAEGAVDDRIKNLEMQIASLQEENTALQTALSSDKSATEKSLELTDRIQALIAAKNNLEQENSTLRTQIGQSQGLAAENEQLKSQIASLNDVKSRLEKEKADLQSTGGEKNRLIAENRELKMQAQVCANEKAELEQKMAGLQSVNDQNQNLLAENQQLTATIAAQTDEISTLKVRLDEIRAMTQMKETSDAQSPAVEADETQ
ncbi:MAG: hypothetical protein PVI49_10090 [Desulfobacterales bacterium]|jgi:DNA repair exonuclease SbcCD ATPase subunit